MPKSHGPIKTIERLVAGEINNPERRPSPSLMPPAWAKRAGRVLKEPRLAVNEKPTIVCGDWLSKNG